MEAEILRNDETVIRTEDTGKKKRKKKEKRPLHASTVRVLVASLLIGIAGIILCYAAAYGAHQKNLQDAAESDVFKTFDLQTVDGGKMNAAELRGTKLVLVNVWGTNCPPCITEMPDLEKLNNSYDDGTFRVIGVPLDVAEQGGTVREDLLEEAKRIVAATGVTFGNIIPDDKMYTFINSIIAGTPTTMFLDQEGNIIKSVTGSRDLEFWKQTVEELLKEVG